MTGHSAVRYEIVTWDGDAATTGELAKRFFEAFPVDGARVIEVQACAAGGGKV